jgi:hypothetical protein
LITVTAGATAVGGGDFTVVVLFEVESVVLLLVESVTMGSAIVIDVVMTKSTAVAIFLIIFKTFSYCNYAELHQEVLLTSKFI